MICHPKYGLCIYVIGELFIILKPDHVDREKFMEEFIAQLEHDIRKGGENAIGWNLTMIRSPESMDFE